MKTNSLKSPLVFTPFALLFAIMLCIPTEVVKGEDDIPGWFDRNRVVLQTGLYNQIERVQENEIARSIDSLGAEVIVRHLKQDWRPPLWHSVVPESVIESEVDYLKAIQQAVKEYSLNLVAYYWLSGEGLSRDASQNSEFNHINSKRYGVNYDWVAPESWVCQDSDGEPLAVNNNRRKKLRGVYLDLASDYKQLILARFKEMVSYGVEAFYFDSTHFPKFQELCLGSVTHEKYKLLYGERINQHLYAVHQGQVLADVFDFWRTELKKSFPDKDIVFVISGTYLSGFTLPHMSFRMSGPGTVFKAEYKHGLRHAVYGNVFRRSTLKKPAVDVKMGAAWAMLRDASNKPVHLWIEKLENGDELLSYIATALGFGSIAAIHMDSADLLVNKETPFRNSVKNAVAYGKKISEYMVGLQPYRQVELVLNEEYRNQQEDYRASWNSYQGNIYRIYEHLVRHGVPVGFSVNGIGGTSRVDGVSVIDVASKHEKYSVKALDKLVKDLEKEEEFVRTDFSDLNSSRAPLHANYFKSMRGDEDLLVSIVPIRADIGTGKYSGSETYDGVKVYTKKIPRRATELLSNSVLPINLNKETGNYEITVPTFRYIALVSVDY